MTTSNLWAEKMRRISQVKPADIALNLCVDPAAAVAVEEAEAALRVVRARARHTLAREHAGQDVTATPEEIEAAVDVDAQVVAARQALANATTARDEATVEFYFRALPRNVYQDLVDAHPPTDAERAKGKNVHDETFAPAVMAACHIHRVPTGDVDDDGQPVYEEHPGMTVEDAKQILDTWSAGDARTLYSSAVAVNEVTRVNYGSLGKG